MTQGHTVFDRRLLRERRARALALGPATFLIERVAADFGGASGDDACGVSSVRSISARRPATLRRVLAESGKVGTIVAANARRLRTRPQRMPRHSRSRPTRRLLPFADGSLDLVVSALALQFVNDLPGTLIQIRRALKPDGLLLAALLGGDTLTELRQAFAAAEAEIEGGVSPRVAPFADLRDLGSAPAAGRLCAAGDRRGPAHRALRLGRRADARSAPHGRDQSAGGPPPRRRSGARRWHG